MLSIKRTYNYTKLSEWPVRGCRSSIFYTCRRPIGQLSRLTNRCWWCVCDQHGVLRLLYTTQFYVQYRGAPDLKWASKVFRQDKNSIGTLSPPIKEIWSFLAPVLWCMGLIKILSALNHKRKKYFRFWLHYYYGAWNFEKNSFRLDSRWKKYIYFCFWLQYYYGAWNLEKN